MTAVPTLYDWLGGMPTLERLTATFYARVPDDPILAPVFARMAPDHPQHVAQFLAEVLGGPPIYSREHGGHANMIRHHLARGLAEPQRRRWLALLLECADEVGLPDVAKIIAVDMKGMRGYPRDKLLSFDEVLELAARYGRTGERETEPAGSREGEPRAEPERPLLGALVDEGLQRVRRYGARAALILMSDLPRIDAADLSRLVALLREHDCVIAPDLREQNTNALALRLVPEHSLQTAFGTGDSFRLHLELARGRGLRTAVHRSIGLGFDVDLPEDYAELAGPVGLPRRSGMNR